MVLHVSEETASRVREALKAGRAESADQIIGRDLASLENATPTESVRSALKALLKKRLEEAEAGRFCEESPAEILAAERSLRTVRQVTGG